MMDCLSRKTAKSMRVVNAFFLVSLLGASAGCQTLSISDRERMSGTVDHIVYGVPDLQVATNQFSGILGIVPAPGGKHPLLGTENTLFSLGGRQYFEILGPSRGTAELQPFAAALAKKSRPDILTFAVESNNLEEVVRVAGEMGFETSGITDGARRTPDGKVLNYRSVLIISEEFGGLLPFFIDWGESPHPGVTSTKGARLVEVNVLHPKVEQLARIYKRLGINVSVKTGLEAAIVTSIKSETGSIVLIGSGRGLNQ